MRGCDLLGLLFVSFWAYLSFFAHPSTAWVGNGNVHAINWDGFNNWYVDSIEESVGHQVVVLTGPEEDAVDSLLSQGRKVLVLGNGPLSCNASICRMEFSSNDYDYKYPIFHLAGVGWLYYLNLIAPVFLLAGLVMLRKVLVDPRFAVIILVFFSLVGVRKYLFGMPMTVDLGFHLSKIGLVSEGRLVSDLFASGITTTHYYPPLFYWLWGTVKTFLDMVSTVKILVIFTLFFSGLTAYVSIRRMVGKKYATIAAVAYQLMPFNLYNLNLRGGFSEAFAFSLVPLVFLFLSESLKGSKKHSALLVMSLFTVAMVHIPSTAILVPSVFLCALLSQEGERTKARVLSLIVAALGLTSFWLVPLVLELGFTSHSASLNFDPLMFMVPKDWNCEGKCLMEAFYVGLVTFSLSIAGVIYLFASRKVKGFKEPMVWLFVSWIAIFFGSRVVFGILPALHNIVQSVARFYIVIGFLSCYISAEFIGRTGRMKRIGKVVPMVLLFMIMMDSYKLTGAKIHSNKPMLTFFSLDGFQRDFLNVYAPDDFTSLASYIDNSSNLFISLEPGMIEPGSYFGHQVQPQVAAATMLGKSVAGTIPRESSSKRYRTFYKHAEYNLYSSENGDMSQDAGYLKFSELLGYLGVGSIILPSARYDGKGCMELLANSGGLFLYNNTCVEMGTDTYTTSINVVGSEPEDGIVEYRRNFDYLEALFSENLDPRRVLIVKSNEPLASGFDFVLNLNNLEPELRLLRQSGLGAAQIEPEIEVSTKEWRNNFIELEIEAAEQGFVMVRKTAYPDWELYINGKKAEIIVAEPAFIAFVVDEGKHEVKLVYTNTNWRHIFGLVTSAIAIFLVWNIISRV